MVHTFLARLGWQPLPTSSPCLPASLCQGAQLLVLPVPWWLWPSTDGSSGQDYVEIDAWFSRPSPVSVCLQVLVLRCSQQPVGGQRSLEQSTRGWVCLLGPSEALAPETLHPGEEAVGGRQCGAVGATAGAGAGPPGWALVSIPDTTRDCSM